MLKIKKEIADQLIHHARKDAPIEACGYLAEKDGIVGSMYPLRNTDNSEDHFNLDPSEQFAAVRKIRDAKQQLRAVYHSHPSSPARPSQEDIRLAHDPSLSYVIVSLVKPEADIRSFIIRNGEIIPEEIIIESES